MKQTDPQLKLRLPPELRRKLDAEAAKLHRPVSSEIVFRLEASFAERSYPASKGAIVEEQFDEMLDRLDFLENSHRLLMRQVKALEERLPKL